MSVGTDLPPPAAPARPAAAPASVAAADRAAPVAPVGVPLVRWELALPAGEPVPAALPGHYQRFGAEGGGEGATHLWVLLPRPGDRPGHDPRLPRPAFVVDNLLAPAPPYGPGEVDGPRRQRFRPDADGDLVRVLDEAWDPWTDPVFGPALAEAGEG